MATLLFDGVFIKHHSSQTVTLVKLIVEINYYDLLFWYRTHSNISISNSVENEEIATDLADNSHSMTEIEEAEADMSYMDSQMW